VPLTGVRQFELELVAVSLLGMESGSVAWWETVGGMPLVIE
jgi:hypothetical protein